MISLDIHKVYKEGSKYLLIINLVTNSFKVLLEVIIVIDTFRHGYLMGTLPIRVKNSIFRVTIA